MMNRPDGVDILKDFAYNVLKAKNVCRAGKMTQKHVLNKSKRTERFVDNHLLVMGAYKINLHKKMYMPALKVQI